MSRNGYDPIPDVEEGLVSKETSKLSPQERYPGANDQEAELLALLDHCIEEAEVAVNIPNASFDAVSSPRSKFRNAILLPSLCSLAVIGGAFGIASAPAIVVSSFPYVAALILFCSSTVPIQKRVLSQSSQAIEAVEQTREVVDSNLDNVKIHVVSDVNKVTSMLDKVMEPIRTKLHKAKNAESALKQLDPKLEFPAPVTGRELDGAADEVENSVRLVKESVSVTPCVPTYLRSTQNYRYRVEFPLLLIFLILQLGNAFTAALFCPVVVENVLPFLFVAVGAYLMAILQIGLVFYLTRPTAMASAVNSVRCLASETTNRVLSEQGTCNVCKDILGTRMESIKQQTLRVISSTKTIEGLMGKIPASLEKPKTPSKKEETPKKKKGFLWFSPDK